MHVRAEAVARGVDPEAAFAWWSAFEPGAADHPGVPATRTILERAPTRIVMRDEGRLLGWRFRETTTAYPDPAARAVRFEGENNVSTFRGTYAFHPHPDGTRVTLETIIDVKGPLRRLEALGKPFADAFVRWDLRFHARELTREIAPGSKA